MYFTLVTIDNETIEEKMEIDGSTYVTLTREVDFETRKKLLSYEYSIIICVRNINSGYSKCLRESHREEYCI